jgi:hypothetical protein
MTLAIVLLVLAAVSLLAEVFTKRPPYFAIGFVIAYLLLSGIAR